MDTSIWWSYFAAAWLIALSPGSGAVLSVGHGLRYGVQGASVTILGLQAGLMGITLIAGVGVGSLLVASATAFTVVKVLGALYLLWLGWKQWRAPVHGGHGLLDEATGTTGTTGATGAGSGAVPMMPARQRFLTGLFTNLTNPKGIVFMVAGRPLLPQIGVLMLTTVAVDLVVMHGYAFTGARLASLLRSARAQRAQNRLFGGVLMAMGASLMWVRRAA